MKRVIIRKSGPSAGAVALRNARGDVPIVLSNRTVFSNPRRVVINWGCLDALSVSGKLMNVPTAISIARNKLLAFNLLKRTEGVNIPKYWTSLEEANNERKGIVLERHTLTGQSGAGIVVRREGESLGSAPLYVRYVRKQREYRVHVFDGKAIAVQQKRKTEEATAPDAGLIRNHHNGWVFCVNSVNEEGLEAVKDMAVAAVAGLRLDFGAVDIVVSTRDEKPYVLEVNTRPGLSSPTVIAAYIEAIKEVASDT